MYSVLSFCPITLTNTLSLYPSSLNSKSVRSLLCSIFILSIIKNFIILSDTI